MLLKKDYSGKTESQFVCDRCDFLMNANIRSTVRVYSGKTGKIKKKWDLCPSCNRKLIKGIENFKKNVE